MQRKDGEPKLKMGPQSLRKTGSWTSEMVEIHEIKEKERLIKLLTVMAVDLEWFIASQLIRMTQIRDEVIKIVIEMAVEDKLISVSRAEGQRTFYAITHKGLSYLEQEKSKCQ